MNLSGKIIVIDNVLSRDECEAAMTLFRLDKINGNVDSHRDTLLCHIDDSAPFLLGLANKIRDAVSFIPNIQIDWAHLVEWNTDTSQKLHKDTTSHETVFTSITYLNNNYTGGETVFLNDIAVVPKVGRTVYFDGLHYSHGVNKITTGIRYTIPIWYKNLVS